MRFIYWILGVLALFVIAFVLPIKPVQDLRNDFAYKMVENGRWTEARGIYLIGEWQGDSLAANNFHVLNYRRAIDGKGVNKEKRKDIAAKAKVSFEKQLARGFAPAGYNRAMFNYKCGTKRTCYRMAIGHFQQAANLGDVRSEQAKEFLLAKKFKGDQHFDEIRKIADRGNPWAAHRFAKSLRFDRPKLKRLGEPYALMAAEAGIADSQQFLGEYFDHRADAQQWLERAATNPVNRSLMAADRLAELAKERGDYAAARKWYKLAATPRADFDYTLIIEPEGLRWRGFQGSRAADANTSQSAAYELALMQLAGQGGPVDKRAAMKNLEYADHWADAGDMLAELKTGS